MRSPHMGGETSYMRVTLPGSKRAFRKITSPALSVKVVHSVAARSEVMMMADKCVGCLRPSCKKEQFDRLTSEKHGIVC